MHSETKHSAASKKEAGDKGSKAEGYTLEDFLEDEDLVQELCNSTPKALQLYFTSIKLRITAENILELLNYIVQEPPPEASHKRAYKYPFMAAEILSCETKEVVDIFFDVAEDATKSTFADQSTKEEEKLAAPETSLEPARAETQGEVLRRPLVERLMSVLSAVQVNPVLAGYWLKVFETLVEKKQLDVLTYLFHFKEHVNKLLQHIYDEHVADAVKRVVSRGEQFVTGSAREEFRSEKLAVVDRLVDNLSSPNCEVAANSSRVLCELIHNKEYLSHLNEKEVLKKVFGGIVAMKEPSLSAGISYLIALIQFNKKSNKESLFFAGYDSFQPAEESSEELNYNELANLAAEHLETFKHFLMNGEKGAGYDTQFGAKIVAFGKGRLKVMELLRSLMQLNNDYFCQRFCELEMPSALLELIKEYYMNTVLHSIIFSVFSDAIHSDISFLVDMVLCLIKG